MRYNSLKLFISKVDIAQMLTDFESRKKYYGIREEFFVLVLTGD